VAVCCAVALCWVASPAAATPDYYPPGSKHCGSFKAGYRIYVSATHMTCKRARAIQREYWLAPKSRRIIVNGGTGANGYVKLKRYPGWKCFSGAGGGACDKRRASAGYQA